LSINEAISFLDSLGQFRIKLSLDRIIKLTNIFGNPQNFFKSIHVGGTNGKGSVCNFLSKILQYSGYKVGLYTSPHLMDIRERVKINDNLIGEKEFLSLLNIIKERFSNFKEDTPTYFEVLTCLAFLYFKNSGIDFGVIEVGLGGRFDATNVIIPEISIITSISHDHTEYLGKKIEEIAFEKGGIIKKGVPVCFGGKSPTAWKVIKKIANEKGCEAFWLYDKKISFKRIISGGKKGFQIKTLKDDYEVFPSVNGLFQGENIAISIMASEILRERGFNISKDAILKGIENASIEGRMEILDGKPKIILDGAHNLDAIKKLLISLEEIGIPSFVLLYASMKDKDIENISKILFPKAEKIVLTKVEEIRGEEPENIVKRASLKRDFIIERNFGKALEKAISLSSTSFPLLVTGSLYLVGAFKRSYKRC
jgi:dihydrofolate synthase/folylpolyglutamate synthase